MIFGQNWAKYQGYSLTFWSKLAHFSHFSLYNQNLGKWFLVKIRQNTKAIALLFGQNWPILATFHSTIKIWENDFWSQLGKIPSLWRYFLGKIFPLLFEGDIGEKWFLGNVMLHAFSLNLKWITYHVAYFLWKFQNRSKLIKINENEWKARGFQFYLDLAHIQCGPLLYQS